MIESNKFDNQKEFVMTSASKKEPFKVNSSKSNLSSLWQSTANHKSLIDNVGTILQLSQPDINFINTLPN